MITCVSLSITNVTVVNADSHWSVCAAVARTTQSPGALYVRTPVEEFTAQPVVVELSTEYEMLPLPGVIDGELGVRGDCGMVTPVVGAHTTFVVPRVTAKLCGPDVVAARYRAS
ncbi:MAG: hypothetical protein ACO3GM_06275, partial [Candidatus Limnocylindrus sp.]